MPGRKAIYAGLMSGTSLDGVDAVLADLSGPRPAILATAHRPFDNGLRNALARLVQPGSDEIDRAGAMSNALAREYAAAVTALLLQTGIPARDVQAVGCHGQTIRHRPERGYTVQIGNAALLAELSAITVVADFRSRDLAAGGQGAPLVPAFHAAVFADSGETRAVLNLGGIANLTYLPASGTVTGFDSGPGNCLLDAWAELHLGTRFDAGGDWAASGTEDRALLARLLDISYFGKRPPKSTGRELFNIDWVRENFKGGESAADVQATLLALTAHSVADALARWCPGTKRLIVCGGGASNARLVSRITQEVRPAVVEPTTAHGLDPMHVEALAFAWLAQAAIEGRTGNLPGVTGARGARVLGAIYPR